MANSEIETLCYGYGLIEGPRVDAEGNLYFSDVPNGGVYRRSPDGEITTAIAKRRGVGGIALHADGGLVVSGRNICHVRDGVTRIVFDPGAPGFNDIMTDAEGRVWCGTIRSDPFAPQNRHPGEAYRIPTQRPGGEVELMYKPVSLTNGIGFSPDGARIYHSDTAINAVIRHDLEDDKAVNRHELAPAGPRFNPDGLAVDEQGMLWVADYGSGCVRGIDPENGNEVERIEVPAVEVTSVAFGGTERTHLYITTADNTDDPERGGTIFRTKVQVPGLEVPLARV